jgi:hypothetical protein
VRKKLARPTARCKLMCALKATGQPLQRCMLVCVGQLGSRGVNAVLPGPQHAASVRAHCRHQDRRYTDSRGQ